MASAVFFLARLNDHIFYLAKIKTTLEDKGDFCGTDDHQCKLGEWLHGEGRNQAAAVSDEMLTFFEKLFEPHKAFHLESSKAISAHEEGDTEAQELAFTEMHKLSNMLVSLLLKMDDMAR